MKLWSNNSVHVVIDSKPAEDISTHDFIRDLIQKGIVEINPYLDKAGIRYPDAEDYFKGKNFSTMIYALESLVAQGVLKQKESTRMIICSSCNSPVVYSKFACPRCASNEVELTQLLEHKECGYIGSRGDFSKSVEMACPRCGTAVTSTGTDFRSIGNFYQCENCSNRFDKPEVIHVCQNCGKASTFHEVKYIKVPSYRVTNEILSQLTSEFPLLENLSVFLENKGFSVKLHDVITGVSGTQSTFDLIAEKGSVRIVMDASLKGNKSDIIAFLAKKIDVNPTKALLLDMSGGTELAALGRIYGIDVFEVDVVDAKMDEKVPKAFEAFISDLNSDLKDKYSGK